MRQYQVYMRPSVPVPTGARLIPLNPNKTADIGLIDNATVRAAIDHMREHPSSVNTTVQAGSMFFSIVQFAQEAEAPNAFLFDREYENGEGTGVEDSARPESVPA